MFDPCLLNCLSIAYSYRIIKTFRTDLDKIFMNDHQIIKVWKPIVNGYGYVKVQQLMHFRRDLQKGY